MNCKNLFFLLFILLHIVNKTIAQDVTTPFATYAGMAAKDESDKKNFFDNIGYNSLLNASTAVSSISDLLVYINTKNLDTFQFEFNRFIDSSTWRKNAARHFGRGSCASTASKSRTVYFTYFSITDIGVNQIEENVSFIIFEQFNIA